MNCRDFKEIADTYLSDELLVETNHEVFRHLENCAACRQELNARREIRAQLRKAVLSDEESTINPIFANKLKFNLREQNKQSTWFNWKFLTPLLASFALVFSFGLFWLNNKISESQFVKNQHSFAEQALNRHEDCGIKHVKEWMAKADQVETDKVSFVKSLANSETKILSVHDCEFEGKHFTHYILQQKENLISVLQTESEKSSAPNTDKEDSIISEKEGKFQIASFEETGKRIFVVSELAEAENLNLARTLSNSIKL